VYTKIGFDNIFENSRGTTTHKNAKGCPVTCQADNEGSRDTALTQLNSCTTRR